MDDGVSVHDINCNIVRANESIRTVLELRSYELKVNNTEQAIHAGEGGGRIGIKTDVAGDMISILITDDGVGIPAENVARIFDPFFTTKEVGKGTGLGLSICYGIIEEHGGDIKVESKLNRGTTVTIELPASFSDNNVIIPGSGVVNNDGSRRRVLVVDDEPAIVDLLTDILTMEGHGVDVAKNGRLALKKLAGTSYDHVITDIKMPEMDGRELHSRIREIDPDLAANIIFMTGDTISMDTQKYLDHTGNVYLVKPFKLQELRETLQKVMKKDGN